MVGILFTYISFMKRVFNEKLLPLYLLLLLLFLLLLMLLFKAAFYALLAGAF